ncbi:hypothetical protein BT69DRAFT_434918 [Atractiella rhizophila]|nr:hypothetical protein BT69DRAFT_434918 [Atractiella rhizophila]
MQLCDPPAMASIREAFSLHYPACMRVAIEAHLPELLATAGSKGCISKNSELKPASNLVN